MREESQRYEAEKEAVLARLKDAEALTNEIQRETHSLKTNLSRKTEELNRLEHEHQANLQRLHELTQ